MELEYLLLDVLPNTYQWKKRVSKLETQTYWEDFELNDEKACESCINKGKQCEEKVVANFKVDATTVLSCQLENYLKEYARYHKMAQGSVCDFLHVDCSYGKFVLNELTCTKKEYVEPYINSKGQNEGKREKARKQLNQVISLLSGVNEIVAYMKMFDERIGLFSWKIPTEDSDNAEKSMGIFMQPQRVVGNITTMSELNNGFKFVQQIYPVVFMFG